ncbi:MAG: hypothetical protein V3S55_15195 [Nitrospiraceae bacterium]
MLGHLSYWENVLSFSPAIEDEHIFERVGRLAILRVEDDERRVIMVSDAIKGSAPSAYNRERNAGLGLYYRWQGIDTSWARWMRHEIEIHVAEGDMFSFDVAPDHKLPWPRLMPIGDFDHTAVALREFRIRAKSAWIHGGRPELKQTLQSVPKYIKHFIQTSVWVSIINEVQKEKIL